MQTQSEAASPGVCPYVAQASLSYPAAPAAALGEPAAAAIARWLSSRDADGFPYDAVVAEFNRVGKHFVATELLEALASARAALPAVGGSDAGVRQLDRFLDGALDKWDGRYANPTYLGLRLLPLPSVDDLAAVERRYDRLFVQLIADAMRFEIAAADGTTTLLPRMRPDARIAAKRCRIGLQIAGPAARRLGLDDGIDLADPMTGARRLWKNVESTLSSEERRTLQLTMLPVSLIHDEHQFIRALQSFEATFALMAVQLRSAVVTLSNGEAEQAAVRVRSAETALREAAALFSLVATMQVEAFRTFREYTEGASAIQSRNYKLVESLCRRPEPARLDAAPYRSVPEVRERVLAGQQTLEEAFVAARAAGRLSADEIHDVEQAMRAFAVTLQRWRRAHYRIAERMLGERTGTGYTEGSPYLRAVMTIPVFTSLAIEDGAPAGEGEEDVRPAAGDVDRPRGRCPFAGGAMP